jgi:hypothetical protein
VATGNNIPKLKDAVENAVACIEKALLMQALIASHWNQRKAAKLLDISYRAMIYKVGLYRLRDRFPACAPQQPHLWRDKPWFKKPKTKENDNAN